MNPSTNAQGGLAEQVRVKYIRIVNRGDTDFTDRYDGIPVVIDARGSQNLNVEWAAHIFGYRDGATRADMLRHTAKRQGWNTIAYLAKDENGRTLAERLFDALEITPITYKLVEEKPDLEQPIPADREALAEDELPAMSLKGSPKVRQNVAAV
jgi:hypothetical protein